MGTFHEEAGKGDHARKRDVSEETFRSNWDAIFGNKEKQGEEEPAEKQQD